MLKRKWVFFGLFFIFFLSAGIGAEEITAQPLEDTKKVQPLEKVERNFGLGWFRKAGYKDFVEPGVSFIKRKPGYSEVIQYSWRPMVLYDMPHKERIDVVRFSFNRYYFSGSERKIFYGAGIGGNVILFNQKLKDWAALRRIDIKDGVNGLGRLFAGMKTREFQFGKKTYPVVLRVDAFISPPYKFGGEIGHAGDKLKLTEITGGVSFSIE